MTSTLAIIRLRDQTTIIQLAITEDEEDRGHCGDAGICIPINQ